MLLGEARIFNTHGEAGDAAGSVTAVRDVYGTNRINSENTVTKKS